jgi:hypothetical protein
MCRPHLNHVGELGVRHLHAEGLHLFQGAQRLDVGAETHELLAAGNNFFERVGDARVGVNWIMLSKFLKVCEVDL